MEMFRLKPEVAGEIGENSKIKYERGIINEVEFLHYEFTGWLGDEILTSHPCFIVSEDIVEDNVELVVSYIALEILKKHKIENCEICPLG